MQTEIIRKWVDALRSGDYIQGEGNLKTVDPGSTKHCCLGVLAEICDLREEKTYNSGDSRISFLFPSGNGEHDDALFALPNDYWWEVVMEMPRSIVIDEHYGDQVNLMNYLAESLNDSGHSFNEIADFLEREFL